MKFDIRILFTPSCWLRNHKTNKTWDESLNKLLNRNPKIKLEVYQDKSFYTVFLDDIEIWISNWPEAYGGRYSIKNMFLSDFLPSRTTAFRLRDYIAKDVKKALEDKKEYEERGLRL